MAGKKLPKAISITADEMRQAAIAPDLKLVTSLPEEHRAKPINGKLTPEAISSGPLIEIQQTTAPVVVNTGPDASRVKGWALDIVHRHAAYSVFGGIIPVPLVNAASVAAINLRMVKLLSELYAVPFEQGRARAVILSLMGGIMPSGVGTVTASTLLYVIPGSALIGLAMSSVSAAACTRAIGQVFVEHFASGATTLDVTAVPPR
jgi:uncharacterized protein (DUF697 family)